LPDHTKNTSEGDDLETDLEALTTGNYPIEENPAFLKEEERKKACYCIINPSQLLKTLH